MAVALVPHQELASPLRGVAVHLVQPVLDVLEGFLRRGRKGREGGKENESLSVVNPGKWQETPHAKFSLRPFSLLLLLQKPYSPLPSFLPSFLIRFAHLVGDVVDHDDAIRPSVVRRGDGAETFLSRRVPL